MKFKWIILSFVGVLQGCSTTSTVQTKIPPHNICQININSRSLESWKSEFGDVEIVEVIGSPSFFVPGSPYNDFGVMSEDEVKRRVMANKELDRDPFTALPKAISGYYQESLKRDIIRDINGLPKRNSVPEFIIRIPKNGKITTLPEKVAEAKVIRSGRDEQILANDEYVSTVSRKKVVEGCLQNTKGLLVQLKYSDKTEEMCLPKEEASKVFGCS